MTIDTKKARELGTNGIGVPDLTEAAALLLALADAHDRRVKEHQDAIDDARWDGYNEGRLDGWQEGWEAGRDNA